MPDAFDILGLEARFDLTAAAIQRAYLQRVTALHPDRAGVAGGPRAESGDGGVSAVNAAKQTLEDPEQRAAALLARLGGPSKEADRSLPDGFLARMMEARESLDEARAAGRAGDLAKWSAWAELARGAHIDRAGVLFALAAGSSAVDPALLRDIRRELNAWRYIERMLEQMESGGGTAV